MPQHTAGMLMCRKYNGTLQFFLVHPGGPFWARKNEGAWSMPKGISEADEEYLDTAQREFHEETGLRAVPPFVGLGNAKAKSGKTIHAWAFLGEWEPSQGITSNYIDVEWPPRSGKKMSIPEVDRAEWMDYSTAIIMINSSQVPFIDRARQHWDTFFSGG